MLCPPETVLPLLQWRRTTQAMGPGLQNLGNTCFLNSVLQCLTYTPALQQYLVSGEHGRQCTTAWRPCVRSVPLDSPSCVVLTIAGRLASFCLMCELEAHVARCLARTSTQSIAPTKIVSKLNCASVGAAPLRPPAL